MKIVLATFALFSLCVPALGQNSPRRALDIADGSYVTAAVRRDVDLQVAEDFRTSGFYARFSAKDFSQLIDALREGKLQRRGRGESETSGAVEMGGLYNTPKGAVLARTPEQSAAIEFALQESIRPSMFERYAVIHIIVIPTPPRDYKIKINGEDCPPTEKSLYKVMPGKSTVSVLRNRKLPCAWAGDVASGKQEDVNCNL